MTPQNSQFIFFSNDSKYWSRLTGCFELGNREVKGGREHTASVGSTIFDSIFQYRTSA